MNLYLLYFFYSKREALGDYNAGHPPLKAYIEPFFSCMKESKGLPLQTTASGSGASVVAVVAGTVVISGGLVVLGTLSVGGTVCEIGVICIPGIF